jgi:hypothetical protein
MLMDLLFHEDLDVRGKCYVWSWKVLVGLRKLTNFNKGLAAGLRCRRKRRKPQSQALSEIIERKR